MVTETLIQTAQSECRERNLTGKILRTMEGVLKSFRKVTKESNEPNWGLCSENRILQDTVCVKYSLPHFGYPY